MDRSTKDAWLTGPGDLQEAEVEDVPAKGMTVRVRGLAAQYSNEAQSKALEMKTLPNGDQIATVNTATLECLQFAYGVIEPQFSLAEAQIIAKRYGPAFKKVLEKIDELSGLDKEAIEAANARFPAGGASPNGADVRDAAAAGSGGSDVPVPVGAGAEDAGG